MTNLETIRTITNSLKSIVKEYDEDILKGFEIAQVRFFYKSESYGHTTAARGYYVDSKFLLYIQILSASQENLTSISQKIVHAIRERITVNNLNINKLEDSEPVTRAEVIEVNICNDSFGKITEGTTYVAELNFDLLIRYREV